MNWLITGGCGFIGISLIARLSLDNDTKHNIRIIDNLSTGTKDDLSSVVTFSEIDDADNLSHSFNTTELIVGDILDEELAYKVTRNIDVIVHLAANTGVGPSVENPRIDCYTNVIGIFNYLDAARINKVPRFIFASSGAPAGEVEPPIHEELPPHPVSPYGASKLAGEGYCSAYNKSFGIDTIVLRFGNVYGPRSLHKSSIVAKFIRKGLAGEALEVYGDGKQTRDFIFIDDLIDALLSSSYLENIGGETFQIASGMETTIGEMTENLINVMKDFGVNDIKVINGETRVGDVKRNYSDTTKAKKRLGWKPKVNQKMGLFKTVEYFLNDSV
jgi:UDP-glucose 4-epimerase